MRKELSEHMEKDCPNRVHNCKHCGEIGTYAGITQVHDEECEKKVLPCPNTECNSTIQRRNVKRHLDGCKYTEVPCKYQKLGCGAKLKRDNLSAHEAEETVHFRMALDKVTSMEEKMLSIAKTQVQDALSDGKPVVFEVPHLSFTGNSYTAPPFYTSSTGYCMAIKIYANGFGTGEDTHMSVFATIQKGKNDKQLKWPFIGDITVTLLNQLEDKNHHNKTIHFDESHSFEVESCRGKAKFISRSALGYNPYKKTHYVKDDSLYLRVSVEMAKSWLKCTLVE
jgi:TNF receptor-associated factor 4